MPSVWAAIYLIYPLYPCGDRALENEAKLDSSEAPIIWISRLLCWVLAMCNFLISVAKRRVRLRALLVLNALRVLKNLLSRNPQKLDRVRMAHKDSLIG
jgi:hypothetical protein